MKKLILFYLYFIYILFPIFSETEWHGTFQEFWQYTSEKDAMFDTIETSIFCNAHDDFDKMHGFTVSIKELPENKINITVNMTRYEMIRTFIDSVYIRFDDKPAKKYPVSIHSNLIYVFSDPFEIISDLIEPSKKMRIRLEEGYPDIVIPVETLSPMIGNALKECKENRIIPTF